MMLTRRAVVTGVASLSLAPGQAAAQTAQRILFIGNSLTYTNNLPEIVRAVCASGGVEIETHMVAKPNFSLLDHWRVGDAREAIENGNWNIVVLQQGPSAQGESRRQLRRYAALFAPLITAAGAQPAMYSVWPARDRAIDFERAAESYALAAADIGAMLFPVATAWNVARRDIELYSPDGLHPNAYGSYLAALVMFAVLAQRTPIGLPTILSFADGGQVRVRDDAAELLQRAAAEATAS